MIIATIQPNDPTYGSVSETSLEVPEGTTVTVSSNTITLDGNTVTATPATDTQQYNYDFDSWSITSGTELTEDTTITATFTRSLQEYDITWNIDGVTTTEQYEYGSTPTHAEPTKPGYEFAGWNPAITMVTQDQTYTATWTTASYTVSITVNDPTYGSVDISSIPSVTYGTTITVEDNKIHVGATTSTATPATDTAQYDYAFDHWSVSSGTLVTSDMTITATFTRELNEYTITWNIDGVATSETYEYGATPTHEDPTKTGYDFAGWNPTIHAVTGAQVYTATWTIQEFDITWNIDGVTTTEQWEYGTTPTHEDPTKTGYTFAGWTPTPVPAVADATYTATWDVIGYTVYYDANGGEVTPDHNTGNIETPIATFPTPTKTGYDFAGWFTSASGGTEVTAPYYPTANITIHAHWTAAEYTVTFDPMAGSVSPETKTVTYGQQYGDLPTAVRDHYTFDGWWTEPVEKYLDGTGHLSVPMAIAVKSGRTIGTAQEITADSIVSIAADHTLYAHYVPTDYTVTLNAHGGTVTPSELVGNVETPVELPIPSYGEQYDFAGWFTQEHGGVQVSSPYTPLSDITLHAQWTAAEQHTWTLQYDTQGGQWFHGPDVYTGYGTADKTVDVTTDTPMKVNYDFLGWATTSTATEPDVGATIVLHADTPLTIYAVWQEETVRVTFDAEGGIAEEDYVDVPITGTYTLPNATWIGHDFLGWYSSRAYVTKIGDAGDIIEAPSTDITIHARWSEATVYIEIDGPTRIYGGDTGVTYRAHIVPEGAVTDDSVTWSVTDPNELVTYEVIDGNLVMTVPDDSRGSITITATSVEDATITSQQIVRVADPGTRNVYDMIALLPVLGGIGLLMAAIGVWMHREGRI